MPLPLWVQVGAPVQTRGGGSRFTVVAVRETEVHLMSEVPFGTQLAGMFLGGTVTAYHTDTFEALFEPVSVQNPCREIQLGQHEMPRLRGVPADLVIIDDMANFGEPGVIVTSMHTDYGNQDVIQVEDVNVQFEPVIPVAAKAPEPEPETRFDRNDVI